QIRRAGDQCAGPGARAVDRRDDRLRTAAHRLHHVTGHAREREQLGHFHLHQLADDVVNVAAGTEISTFAGEHDSPDVGSVNHLAEEVAQLAIGFEGERVLSFWPVELDRGHFARDRITEVDGLIGGELDAFHHGFTFPCRGSAGHYQPGTHARHLSGDSQSETPCRKLHIWQMTAFSYKRISGRYIVAVRKPR